jgi:hypothetical protein
MAWTNPRTWSDGELVTKAIMDVHVRDNLNILRWAFARKTSDQSITSSTTLTDVTGVNIAVAASEVWAFQTFLTCTAAASGPPDIKFEFTGPAGSTIVWSTPGSPNTGDTYSLPLIAAGGAGIVTGADTTQRGYMGLGTIVNAGTAGNLQLQFAQSTSSASAATIKANSWLLAFRMA